MIRLRAVIQRGLRNPWLRPLVIILLALLLALVVLHSAGDQKQAALDGGPPLLVCFALALVVATCLVRRVKSDPDPVLRSPSRAPPLEPPQPVSGTLALDRTTPLRL